MIKIPSKHVSCGFLLFSIAVVPLTVFPDGFRNPPEGARAVGAFGGYRAFADDANAVIHNPANLVDLERPVVQLNTTFGYGRNEFRGATGTERTRSPFFALPGFSAAVPLAEGKVALGLAAYVPYGRSVEWNRAGNLAAVGAPYYGSMMVADVTPNVAVRINDALSVAVGADIYYGEVEQRQFIMPVIMPGVESRLTGDGTGFGWNAALTWKVTERQRVAATYRAPFSIRYRGHDDWSTGARNNIDAEIDYPAIAALAYGIECTETVRLEFNAEWLEFSRYQRLVINHSLLGRLEQEQKLKNTWTAGAAVQWDFKPRWTALAGYKYLRNPTPNASYSPVTPDQDQGVASLGIGYRADRHSVDIGYAVGLFPRRTVQGSDFNPDGKYDYRVHLLSLSYGYRF